MGLLFTKPNPIPTDTLYDILTHTHFKENEVKTLFKRFNELDIDGNGQLDIDELMKLQGMRENPFATRIIDVILLCPKSGFEVEKPLIRKVDSRKVRANSTKTKSDASSSPQTAAYKINIDQQETHTVNFFQFCYFLHHFQNISDDYGNEKAIEDDNLERENMFKILFSMYDTGKKGYITEDDVIDLLSHFILESQETQDQEDQLDQEVFSKPSKVNSESLIQEGVFSNKKQINKAHQILHCDSEKTRRRISKQPTIAFEDNIPQELKESDLLMIKQYRMMQKITKRVFEEDLGEESNGSKTISFDQFKESLKNIKINDEMQIKVRGDFLLSSC